VLRDCLPSETGPCRSATEGRPARGQAFQRWLGQLVSRGHLPKQGRVETVSAVTAEAGRVGTFPRARVHSTSRVLPSDSCSNAEQVRRSAHLKARTRRGQAALPIAAGAWEAHRATGYV